MMSAKTLVIGIVGAGCMAAAGVGGYLAVRTASTTTAASPTAAVAEPASVATAAPEIGPGRRDQPSARPVAEAARPSVTRREVAERPAPTPAASTPELVEPAPAPATPATVSAPAEIDAPFAEPAVDAGPAEASVEPMPAVVEESPRVMFEELTVPEHAVIGIRLDTAVSSATARVEDRVQARVTRDVTVDSRVAVPSGSRLEGVVTTVERGGRFRERSRLGVRFTAVVLPDDTRVPVQTETIFRMGEAPGGEATSKIGAGAVLGTILGAVIGGKKGAAIGGTAGAAGGTAAVMAGGPNDVVLPVGTSLTVRLTDEVAVRVPLER